VSKEKSAIQKRWSKGFSLLELLLVLVILSIISSIGIYAVREYSTSIMVERTANSMKNWLQAGSDYYIDNQAWPTSSDELENYLYGAKQGQLATNPWGQSYSLVDGADPDSNIFQIKTTVQTEVLAKRVAGLLTNAKAEGLVVTASVSKPLLMKSAGRHKKDGQQLLQNHIEWIGFLIDDGTKGNNYVIPIPDCTQYDDADSGTHYRPVLMAPPSYPYPGGTPTASLAAEISLINYGLVKDKTVINNHLSNFEQLWQLPNYLQLVLPVF